ncbi:MAG: DegT/DnrJ/EryC1/StrS family aminotransferase [bacterium JZ-2024 1]
MHIPLFDFSEVRRQTDPEAIEAMEKVFRSGRYILGDEVSAFERELAAFTGVPEVVGVASGTDALVLALKACGVDPGDGVIVPAFTFMATASAVFWVGAIPVFADVDEWSGLVTRDTLREAFACADRQGIRVRAMITVDLYGRIPDMERVQELADEQRVPIIEDACQALGSWRNGKSAGAFAPFAAFSFYPTKNLGGIGDGGALAVQDCDLAGFVRRLRNHGMTQRYIHPDVGTNSRLDEVQAAVLRARLRRLSMWASERRRLRSLYDREISGGIPRDHAVPLWTAQDEESALHLYVIRLLRHNRDLVRLALADAGVETGVYYPVPLPDQEAVTKRLPWVKDLHFPGARALASTVVALPFFVGMTEDQIRLVVTQLARAMGL